MKIDSKPEGPGVGKPAKSLGKALEQSRRVKDLVEEAANDLSSANAVLKQELVKSDTPPVVEKAIEKTEVAEDKVQEASEQLVAVNQTLKEEIRERHVLEFQYAAATEQKDAARHESLHDPLTGLPNGALFNDRIEHGLAQAQRHGWNLAVMFMDLDNFKAINDTHGHDVGDGVLKLIASRLMENTREDDTISRRGGDEFLYLLMENRNKQDVTMIAEKLVGIFQAPCEVRSGDRTISLTIRASIGIAMYPGDGVTAEALLKAADDAMYRAKKEKSGYLFAV